MVDKVASANAWRIKKPTLQKGKWGSLIEPLDKLTKAIPSSNGNYLFSEVGAGVFPIGVIGSVPQIFQWLHKHSDKNIVSNIKELPHVYMAMTRYDAQKTPQFYGPVQIGGELIKQLTAFIPGGTDLTDFTGGVTDFYDLLQGLFPKVEHTAGFDKGLHILTFTYMPIDGFMQVDTQGKVDFKHIARGVYQMWLKSK